MKIHSVQMVVLMAVSAINLCSAAHKTSEKKKCPPHGVQLTDNDTPEDYEALAYNWKIQKCTPNVYCDNLECLEFTFGINDKGVVVHGSAYNKSSSKVWAAQGNFKVGKEGELKLDAADNRANGRHYYVANKRFYFQFVCFEDQSSGAWVGTKGNKLEEDDEKEIKELAEKCGVKLEEFKSITHEDCTKKKLGY